VDVASEQIQKPIVLITGAAGNIGRSLAAVLAKDYQVVGLDRPGTKAGFPLIQADLSKDDSVEKAVAEFRNRFGDTIASVVHLAAYFDFTGIESPLYRSINVEGTRRLLRDLQQLDVEQFVYSGTMLVHAPGKPGERINEDQPIEPKWAYPQSKAEAEDVIRAHHGEIPYVLLHLAGLYDDETAVPTLANQIARIYERDLQSYFYSGSTQVGQAMVHRDDMLDAFKRTIDRRRDIPSGTVILIGEEEAPGYDALQDEIGYLIHGSEDWPTLRVPKPAAAAGAWVQAKAEPLVPDALDQGEKPFVKPFMVAMADDHYELDVSCAKRLLGWEPEHKIKDVLPKIVAALKRDPHGWYEKNDLKPPPALAEAQEAGKHPERLRAGHEALLLREHRQFRWAHFVTIGLGIWLIFQPPLIGVEEPWLARSETLLGFATLVFATVSLSWRLRWARWATAGVGALVMGVPFLFWTTNGAAYLSDTLVGMLIFGLAVGSKPDVGPSVFTAYRLRPRSSRILRRSPAFRPMRSTRGRTPAPRRTGPSSSATAAGTSTSAPTASSTGSPTAPARSCSSRPAGSPGCRSRSPASTASCITCESIGPRVASACAGAAPTSSPACCCRASPTSCD
jgi:nucleoside-diphosphate-sugar epimerase